ncbi:MAG: methyltransferase domain-containing protein [Acidobacteriota bacterium]|nr:methyltransferase domain-containing protein [Acidobacteriota bacterium]
MLLCTVRNCRAPLVLDERRYVCANAHAFDVARSGYVNLLQPQDKKSKTPGDTPEAVAARRRFLEDGNAAPLVDAIVRALPMHAGEALLDAGCGEGHHLAAFRRAYGVAAHGIDISVPAIELAARRYRDCSWVVGNADRFLPYPDAMFRAVTSITARMNAEEFRRVLASEGTLLIVIPGAGDLVELREAILGERVERDRVERTAAAFASLFQLQRHERIAHTTLLDRQSMIDVMSSSYRGLRARERATLETLDAMSVTLSRDLLLFTPR